MVKIVSYSAFDAPPPPPTGPALAPSALQSSIAPVAVQHQPAPMPYQQPMSAHQGYAPQSQMYAPPGYVQPPQPAYAPPMQLGYGYGQPFAPNMAMMAPPSVIAPPPVPNPVIAPPPVTHLALPSASSPNVVRSSGWRTDIAHKTQERVKQEWQAAELQKQIEEKRRKKEKLEHERRQREAKEAAEEAAYNPWGRVGAGAPLRDDTGQLHADLRLKNAATEQPEPPPPPQPPAAQLQSPLPSQPSPPVPQEGPRMHARPAHAEEPEEESIFSLVGRPIGCGPSANVPAALGYPHTQLPPQGLPAPVVGRAGQPPVPPGGRGASAVRSAPRVHQPARVMGTAPAPRGRAATSGAGGKGRPPPRDGGLVPPSSRGCSGLGCGASSVPSTAVGSRRGMGRAQELEAALQQRDGQIHELRRQIERQQALLMQRGNNTALPADALCELVGAVFPDDAPLSGGGATQASPIRGSPVRGSPVRGSPAVRGSLPIAGSPARGVGGGVDLGAVLPVRSASFGAEHPSVSEEDMGTRRDPFYSAIKACVRADSTRCGRLEAAAMLRQCARFNVRVPPEMAEAARKRGMCSYTVFIDKLRQL